MRCSDDIPVKKVNSRTWRISIVTGVLFLICASYCCISTSDTTPIVVLREDDIRATWRIPFQGFDGMTGLQYGKLKRIPITWGVITDAATSGWGLTWAELRDYLETAGGEAASHSCTHRQMSNDQEYIAELINSKAIIEQNLPGFACTTFLLPGDWKEDARLDHPSKLDNAIGQALQSTYSQSQAYLGRGWHVGPRHYLYGLSANWSLDYDMPTAEAVRAILDLISSTPGLVFVFTCHGLKNSGEPGDGVPINVMRAFMDKAAELRDQGKIRLMSLCDAYAAASTLPGNLNRLVDPDFEAPDLPLSSREVWSFESGARKVNGDSFSGSKYCQIPAGGKVGFYDLIVTPGRYRLSWKQKIAPNQPTPKSLRIYAENFNSLEKSYALYGPAISCNTVNSWESKSVLLLIKEGRPNLRFWLTSSDATLGVDDFSLVSDPINPTQSPSGSSAIPTPTNCMISWKTPDNPNTQYIDVRLGTRTYPKDDSDQEGTLLARISASPGSMQNCIVPINWSQYNPGIFISLFAVLNDGTVSEPELVPLIKDTTAPSIPQINSQINQQNLSITITWSSSDSESGIHQYCYAVGTDPEGRQIIPWTTTTANNVILESMPIGVNLCISVKAQNAFGLWSATASHRVRMGIGIADAVGLPDGTKAVVSGKVTALFGDHIYIQQSNPPRGLRVNGYTNATEGADIVVSGVMNTVNGERVLVAN